MRALERKRGEATVLEAGSADLVVGYGDELARRRAPDARPRDRPAPDRFARGSAPAGRLPRARRRHGGARAHVRGGARARAGEASATNLKGGEPETFGKIRSFFYERLAQPCLAPLHLRLAAEIPIGEGRLLDVGCGPGNLDRMLAERRPGLSVVGVDESEPMIRRAGRGPRLANLEFRLGSVQSLTFREEFDFALTVLSFHHWEEPEAGLEAVYGALKPGGRFWMYEGNPEAPSEDLRRDRAPICGFLRMPERMWRKVIRGHGFTLAEVESVVRPVVARTPFGTCVAAHSGSMLRIELAREA